jgi:hypothetical protein
LKDSKAIGSRSRVKDRNALTKLEFSENAHSARAASKSMPICVECGEAVDSLYTVYSKGSIYLTKCVLHQCRYILS